MGIIISIEDLTKSVALVFLILRCFGCVPLTPKLPAIFITYRDRASEVEFALCRLTRLHEVR